MVVLVQHHHHHHHKTLYSPEIESNNINSVLTRKSKPVHLHLLLLSLFSFTLAFLLFPPPSLFHFIPNKNPSSISCDRTAFRTDVCYLTGHLIRTHSNSSTISLLLPSTNDTLTPPSSDEKIRPYPRKWETAIMSRIPQLRLRRAREEQETPCDVLHNVPAVVFSTGGYTGNVFHEFNEGIIPLYITSHHFGKNVIFVILQYKNWWVSKYRDVLSRLSGFDPIDFYNDTRTHCFREAIVGLSIHNDLSIDSEKMGNNDSIRGFRKMLDEAYRPRIRSIELEEEEEKNVTESIEVRKPKLVVLSRIGSRAIENEEGMVTLAEEIGFRVKVNFNLF